MFNANEYKLNLVDAVKKLGYHGDTAYPLKPNAENASEVIEYAIAKPLYDAAKSRYERARAQLQQTFNTSEYEVGASGIAYDDAFCALTYNVVNNPQKLDEVKLLNTMVREFEIDVAEARKLIEDCKTRSPGGQVRLNAVLKNGE